MSGIDYDQSDSRLLFGIQVVVPIFCIQPILHGISDIHPEIVSFPGTDYSNLDIHLDHIHSLYSGNSVSSLSVAMATNDLSTLDV